MRIVHWNCNNGMSSSEQIAFFRSLKPDVAILPELKYSNISALEPNSWSWITNNKTNARPKGLGVLGFGDTTISEHPRDEDMELFLPLRITHDGYCFNLVAVWNFYSACKQGRFRGVRGDGALEYTAIRKYASTLNTPCIFGGDWNFGPTFSQHAFLKICEMFRDFGYESLYHHHYTLGTDVSRHHTFRTPSGHFHHLDHLFATTDLADHMASYEVVPLEHAVRSDHSPIVLEFTNVQPSKT